MLLQVEGLSSAYGRVAVLHDVSIAVAAGSIVAIVGANGAGKSTLLRAISGIQPITGGNIVFAGRNIGRLPAGERVCSGIVQVPEGRQVFEPLSVEDNLNLGGYTRPRASTRRLIEQVVELFPVLAERRTTPAGALSGGEQQMLAIGRALMAEPKLLILDEPSLGLAPMMVSFIFERIRKLNQLGMTFLIVEQNIGLTLETAHHGYVLETGRVTLEGSGAHLLGNPAVHSSFLGM